MPTSNFNPNSIPSLYGRTFIVTGGNNGIGKATVAGLASHGATVYMGARSEEKAVASINEIKKELPEADVQYLYMDLTNLASIVAAALKIKREVNALHGLVNNAGIMGVEYAITDDGYEVQFQTNYLAHWLLTYHLLPLLRSTAAALPNGSIRVVNITSDGHERFAPKPGIDFGDLGLEKANSMTRYGQSKLAQILHIKRLSAMSRSLAGESQVSFAAVHPGHIDTNLNRQTTALAPSTILKPMTKVMRCLGILDEQQKGAWSTLFAIASTDFKSDMSGSYIVPYARIGTPSEKARDAELANRMWEWTEVQLRDRGFLDTQL